MAVPSLLRLDADRPSATKPVRPRSSIPRPHAPFALRSRSLTPCATRANWTGTSTLALFARSGPNWCPSKRARHYHGHYLSREVGRTLPRSPSIHRNSPIYHEHLGVKCPRKNCQKFLSDRVLTGVSLRECRVIAAT